MSRKLCSNNSNNSNNSSNINLEHFDILDNINNNSNNDNNNLKDPYDDHYVKMYDKIFDGMQYFEVEANSIKKTFELNDDSDSDSDSNSNINSNNKNSNKNSNRNSNKIINQASYNKWGKDEIRILDAGCGSGKHFSFFADKFKIVGIDHSKSFLQRAQLRNPTGKFILGDITNDRIVEPISFTHILCLVDTLYHNKPSKMDDIFENFSYWLKPDGLLYIHVYDKTLLDPAPREFSQHYYDDNKNKHSITYYKTFTHDAWWKVGDDDKDSKDVVYYNEKYIVESGKAKLKVHKMYMPPKEKIIGKIQSKGFELVDIIALKDLGILDHDLYVFKKIKAKTKKTKLFE
jgi:SAM-dependent methyltransferase